MHDSEFAAPGAKGPKAIKAIAKWLERMIKKGHCKSASGVVPRRWFQGAWIPPRQPKGRSPAHGRRLGSSIPIPAAAVWLADSIGGKRTYGIGGQVGWLLS